MNPPPNFDRLARLYRWMELMTFGPWLWRCRCAFLAEIAGCRHALVLGDGDGRFTARLLAENSPIEIDAIDASPAMLKALTRRARHNAARVRTHLADARLWRPSHSSHLQSNNPPYHLIVTHFFLDCLTTEEVQSLASELRRAAAPSALWLVSEFAIPAGWLGRTVARPLIWSLYLAFGWLTGLSVRTLPDHRSALGVAGFILLRRRTWLAGLLIAELWSVSQTGIS
jgi:SAM-dependent methyltransferase